MEAEELWVPGYKITNSDHLSLEINRPRPKYSICVTNYNTRDTIRESLESILKQIDSSFEVVVCDNLSTDGSNEILEEYAKSGKLRLITQKSTRGRGRQIAFEYSSGDYILSGADMDDTFKPTIKDILTMYHEKHEGYMLSFETVHIIPRAIVEEVGGWKDIQWGEDVDFAKRVESIHKIHYFDDSSPLIMKRGLVRRGIFYRFRSEYIMCQSKYRLGYNVFEDLQRNRNRARDSEYRRAIRFLIALAALMTCKIKRVSKFDYSSKNPRNQQSA